MAHVLIVDEEAKKEIMRVRAFAEKENNWYYPDPMASIYGSKQIPGNNPEYVCFLGDFRCVYTLTVDKTKQHFRHLSISINSFGLPHPAAAFTICELFGFTGWDGLQYEKIPLDWFGCFNKKEHCVTLAQKIKKEQIQ